MATTARRIVLALAAILAASSTGYQPAAAHPHVFVSARSDLVFDETGALTGVKQHWTFDESYSAFAVQGLDSKHDGKPTREDLQGLAKVNVESLAEYAYFTSGKTSGRPLEFGEPADYWLDFADQKLTLNFTLPLKTPVSARTLTYRVYDPTYFVSFTFAEQDPVRLIGAKPGCTVSIKKPPSFATSSSGSLSEHFFNQLGASGSDYGAGFADHALVACP